MMKALQLLNSQQLQGLLIVPEQGSVKLGYALQVPAFQRRIKGLMESGG